MTSDLDRINARFRFGGSFVDPLVEEAYLELADTVDKIRGRHSGGEVSVENQERIWLASRYFTATFNTAQALSLDSQPKGLAEALQVLTEAEFYCSGRFRKAIGERIDETIEIYNELNVSV